MSVYQKKEKQGQFVSMGRQGGNLALKQMKRHAYQSELRKAQQEQHAQAMDDAKRTQLRTTALAPVTGFLAGGPVGGIAGGVMMAANYYATTGNYKPFLFPGAEFIPGWGAMTDTAIGDIFDSLF